MAAARKASRRRWRPLERELRERTGPLVAGVDEVGRGPLAGPVVACAVIMPPDERAIRGVDDSKKLLPAERVKLAARIRDRATSWALGAASVREIEKLNIYHATTLAMRRALRRLSVRPDHVLIDGRPIRGLEVPHTAIVHGDACCYSIACASILAKVTRDRAMGALARRHPGYGWERNVGYATPAHIQGLGNRGLSPHHRRTFFRVRQVAEGEPGAGIFEPIPSVDPESLDIDIVRAVLMDDGSHPSAEDIDVTDVLLDLVDEPAHEHDAGADSFPG